MSTFVDKLPIPSFAVGDTVKAKSEIGRKYMHKHYYICDDDEDLFLRDHKNNFFGKTNYYTLEEEAVNCKMLLTEILKQK